jgi:hypothetical protein
MRAPIQTENRQKSKFHFFGKKKVSSASKQEMVFTVVVPTDVAFDQ